jgi:hypothetical protein
MIPAGQLIPAGQPVSNLGALLIVLAAVAIGLLLALIADWPQIRAAREAAARQSRLEWCYEQQRWSRDQLAAGNVPRELAVLGMSDALMEEVLIRQEAERPG